MDIKALFVIATCFLVGCWSVSAQVDTAQTSVQRAIVDQHNSERAIVSPTASNMKRVEWDAEAARSAQRWADRCDYEHSSSTPHSQYGSCGENLAASSGSTPSWADAIKGWSDEKHDYSYGQSDFNNGGRQIGHYTQMIWADSAYVGCGYKRCPGSSSPFGGGWFSSAAPWDYFVCHYCPPGNINVASTPPYRRGASCSACPSGWKSCVNKLCSKSGTSEPNPEPVVEPVPSGSSDCENAEPDHWSNCAELEDEHQICTVDEEVASQCQKTCLCGGVVASGDCSSARPDEWGNCWEMEVEYGVCGQEVPGLEGTADECQTTCLCQDKQGRRAHSLKHTENRGTKVKRTFSRRFPASA